MVDVSGRIVNYRTPCRGPENALVRAGVMLSRTATNASVGVVLALVLGQQSSLWRLGPLLVPRPLVPAGPW